MILRALTLGLLVVAAGSARAADFVTAPTLTLEGAQRIADAALTYARQHGAPGAAVAVVDAGGHTILVERLDGTFAAGPDISIGKARTAVTFKRPTRGIEETINKGRAAMVPLPAVTWFTPLQGGVPVMIAGEVAGGVGVSGASSAQQDEEVAIAGAAAMTDGAPRARVEHVPADRVTAAFGAGETGGTLVSTPRYRVSASRRDGTGEAEIHTLDTDIFYVLDGSATVITGGRLVGSHEVAPGEIRGSSIVDGESHSLTRGEVFVIPQGVPHWFKRVNTPFRYYVIKSVTGS